MIRVLTYLFVAMFAVGCTFYEKATIDDIQRPGAAVRIDTARLVNLYVFDQKDTLLFFRQFDSTAVIDSLEVLDGVSEGRYRVVSFVNCTRYRFSELTVGQSSFEDLECEMVDFLDPSGVPIATLDSVRYGNDYVESRWGQRVPFEVPMRDLYYEIGVRITVAEGYEFWDKINLTSMEVRRLPRRFNNRGGSSDPSVVFMISNFNQNDPEKIAARLRVPRFSDDDRVELHIVSGGYSLGSVVLLPSKFGVSPDAKDRVSFVVDTYVQPRQMTISVNDWVAGVIQTTVIGG